MSMPVSSASTEMFVRRQDLEWKLESVSEAKRYSVAVVDRYKLQIQQDCATFGSF